MRFRHWWLEWCNSTLLAVWDFWNGSDSVISCTRARHLYISSNVLKISLPLTFLQSHQSVHVVCSDDIHLPVWWTAKSLSDGPWAIRLPQSIPCRHLHLRRFSCSSGQYVSIFSGAKKAQIMYHSKCSANVKLWTNLNLSRIIVIILLSLICVTLTSPVSWVTSQFRLHSPRSHKEDDVGVEEIHWLVHPGRSVPQM